MFLSKRNLMKSWNNSITFLFWKEKKKIFFELFTLIFALIFNQDAIYVNFSRFINSPHTVVSRGIWVKSNSKSKLCIRTVLRIKHCRKWPYSLFWHTNILLLNVRHLYNKGNEITKFFLIKSSCYFCQSGQHCVQIWAQTVQLLAI